MRQRHNYKRKRNFTNTQFKNPRAKQRRVMIIPGRTRQVGFYGRYSGPSQEYKFFDFKYTVDPVPTAGHIESSLINIVQGTTESQRVGRKCTIKRIGLKIEYSLNRVDTRSEPPIGNKLRIILYQDRQCNGAAATPSQILEDLTTGDAVRSFRNLSESGRFRLMMDRVFTLTPQTLTRITSDNFSSSNIVRFHQFYKNCNIPIEYSGPTGAIGEIRSNNIGMLLISDNNTTDTTINVTSRVRFSDM